MNSDDSDDETTHPGGDDPGYEHSTQREILYLWAEVELMYRFEKTLSSIDIRSDVTVFIIYVRLYIK